MYSKTPVSSAYGFKALRGPRAERKVATIGPSSTNHEASPMKGVGTITSLCPSVTGTRPGDQDSRQT